MLVVVMMMTVARRSDFFQSTTGVSVVSAAAAKTADFHQVIVSYPAKLATQNHRDRRFSKKAKVKFRLLLMSLGIMLIRTEFGKRPGALDPVLQRRMAL